jgi:hypothetical protein
MASFADVMKKVNKLGNVCMMSAMKVTCVDFALPTGREMFAVLGLNAVQIGNIRLLETRRQGRYVVYRNVGGRRYMLRNIKEERRFNERFNKNRAHGEIINPLTPNDLKRRRAVSSSKLTIPSKNLGWQRCAEGFNSGVKGFKYKYGTP